MIARSTVSRLAGNQRKGRAQFYFLFFFVFTDDTTASVIRFHLDPAVPGSIGNLATGGGKLRAYCRTEDTEGFAARRGLSLCSTGPEKQPRGNGGLLEDVEMGRGCFQIVEPLMQWGT